MTLPLNPYTDSLLNGLNETVTGYVIFIYFLGRKRRKQTHVPADNKDERYWARRLKNNEAAKKSRDMRIKREKVIFEENIRLENMVNELKSENENLSTENKELHLKLGLILEENARLKSLFNENN